MEKSGSIDFLHDLLSNKTIKSNISSLVDGAFLSFNLYLDFSVQNFKTWKEIMNHGNSIEINNNHLDVLFSYLFITRYLTDDGNGRYKLPNKEMMNTLDSNQLNDLTNNI